MTLDSSLSTALHLLQPLLQFRDPSLQFADAAARIHHGSRVLRAEPAGGRRAVETRVAGLRRRLHRLFLLAPNNGERQFLAGPALVDHFAQLVRLLDCLAADLSGGQMKLLELGRSLIGAPKLLLLDEPTAGVAPALAYSIFEQIERLRSEGLTFLIIEHRLEILFDFVDSLYVMHLGRVIAQGTPDEIAANQEVREVYFGE